MTARPCTSKPRGVCKFYSTQRGCLAGSSCKFLHGQDPLTPFDKAKVCKFYAAGYCKRGTNCWFRHITPDPKALPAGLIHAPQPTDEICGICLEKPLTFGLLSQCSHIFCLECIREWRDQNNKSIELTENRTNKRCPCCRLPSSYILPSSLFYPHEHPGKAAAAKRFKDSVSRVPCKYFEASPPENRFCPFGSDCLYKHQNDDGTTYRFPRGVDYYMPQHQARLLRAGRSSVHASDYAILDNVNTLFRDVRAALAGVYRAVRDGSLTVPLSDTDDSSFPTLPDRVMDEYLVRTFSVVTHGREEQLSEQNLNPSTDPSTPEPLPQDWEGINLSLTPDIASFEQVGGIALTFETNTPSELIQTHLLRQDELVHPIPYTPDIPIPSTPLEHDQDQRTIVAVPTSVAALNTTNPVHAPVSSEDEHSQRNDTDEPVMHSADGEPCTVLSTVQDSTRVVDPGPEALVLEAGAEAAAEGRVDVEAGVAEESVSHSHTGRTPEPPFMTDGRGRVVWSRTGSKRSTSPLASET